MPQEYSFDVVSDFDRQELVNAVDQAKRELATRYDFRGTAAELTLHDTEITILGESEMKLEAMREILIAKMVKRNLSPKILDPGKIEPAAKGNVRQEIALRKGVPELVAKDLQKRIKAISPKVQARIQGDQLRVTARVKDDLQSVITALRELDLPAPLQFVNYR